ncbi:hypothetical protein [Microbacterium sp. SORGH_AS_0888]|uniref:hypothetical protein n=1 Tax=Microbacterium sp. SORGH_AS_0888 TaxID=3041791 RepID=UPI00278AD686|nr:hypothetical protein [Microbacterium sp. SORGH_AS_0888]MDQ1127893.1 hypothetical protein [Microbacterium sp. SORGH_AS_0888]
MTRRRHARGRAAIIAAAVGVLVVVGATAASALARPSVDPSPAAPVSAAPAAAATVPLAPLVAAWPDAYTVTGTKAEPLYTERITATRSGERFAVRIEAIGQGDAAMGTQVSVVSVSSGAVTWRTGCTKSPAECDADPALRGFLATAAVTALAQSGRLPATGTARVLHGAPVVCIEDAALHPDAAPAVVELDPCVDPATGAVLGHWSPDSRAFVGPTLAAGFRVTTAPDLGLLPAPPSVP